MPSFSGLLAAASIGTGASQPAQHVTCQTLRSASLAPLASLHLRPYLHGVPSRNTYNKAWSNAKSSPKARQCFCKILLLDVLQPICGNNKGQTPTQRPHNAQRVATFVGHGAPGSMRVLSHVFICVHLGYDFPLSRRGQREGERGGRTAAAPCYAPAASSPALTGFTHLTSSTHK
jgi:hypothetical protein